MRISARNLAAAFLSAAILAACGGGNNGLYPSTSVAPQIGAPQSAAAASESRYLESSFGRQMRHNVAIFRTLFSFNKTDGEAPRAGLTDLNGTLYGTTFSGGASNAGTVFKITRPRGGRSAGDAYADPA